MSRTNILYNIVYPKTYWYPRINLYSCESSTTITLTKISNIKNINYQVILKATPKPLKSREKRQEQRWLLSSAKLAGRQPETGARWKFTAAGRLVWYTLALAWKGICIQRPVHNINCLRQHITHISNWRLWASRLHDSSWFLLSKLWTWSCVSNSVRDTTDITAGTCLDRADSSFWIFIRIVDDMSWWFG